MLTNVIGPSANMLPIRTVDDDSPAFAEYLKDFEFSLIDSLAHDNICKKK